ncbi:unnamed protein product [Cuscuta epithymum]|uniref:Uncharacterized protein n=1 Tax=Cuscuta epithymum TaxID=186058 RepID=A0AAV0E846_9ASTE|nr:unnamed protein product [Cuscuta epithymum]
MDDNDRLAPWELPEGLKSSSKLSSFSAAGCNIQGPLPPFFNVSLVGLYLSNNNLSGDISALQNLTGLDQIELQHNQLSGEIPDLSRLQSLKYLYLNNNNLTGHIPESLKTLPYLVELDLSNNQLAGPLPTFPSGVTVVICGNPGFDPC